MSYTYTQYYENNTTLPSINFEDHANAVAYFKNITSSITEYCSPTSMYTVRFNTTETMNEIATNLTGIYDYANSILCTKIYRKAGVKMMDYACKDKEATLDNFYLEFTNSAKEEYNAELVYSNIIHNQPLESTTTVIGDVVEEYVA